MSSDHSATYVPAAHVSSLTVRYCRENWNWFLRYVPICATPLIRVKPGPSVYSTSFE